ncbi:MAG TPA: hypothetical protein VFD03_06440 [Clostridia bacterium]|nr:hypothetical protein [Clostridia bacterium]
MKKKLSIFLCVLMLLVMSSSFVFAENSAHETATAPIQTSDPSEKFITFCDEYFADHTSYQIINEKERDISESFYTENVDNYRISNISAIWEYAKQNVMCFSKVTTIDVEPQTRGSYITKNISQWFYYLNGTGGAYTPSYEIQYTLAGSFVYNYNTGIISSYSGPTITLNWCSLNGVWSASMINATTRGVIAANKYSVTFTGNFKLKSLCSIPIGGLTIPGFTETFGPYYATLVGTPD